MAKVDVTPEMEKNVLNYDLETGIFTRKVRLAQRHKVGDRADLDGYGSLKGYKTIGMYGQKILAHRAAWAYVHGEWPDDMIDHVNGKKSDNRICNLRQSDAKMNLENLRKAKVSNKSGLLGVHLHKQSNKWRSRIQVGKKSIHVGLFKTPEEAHAAYLEAKRKLHEGCTI